MANPGDFVVNRSGIQIPVWAGMLMSGGAHCVYDRRTQIGTLMPNEFYRFHRHGGFCDQCLRYTYEIRFRNAAGNFVKGYLHHDQVGTNHQASILNFRIFTEAISGNSYAAYRTQNRLATIKRQDGTDIEQLAIGTYIASNTALMGTTHLHFWLIDFVRRGGIWTRTDIAGHTWGFINTGLLQGDLPNTVTIRTGLAT